MVVYIGKNTWVKISDVPINLKSIKTSLVNEDMTTPFLMSAFVLLSWDKLSYVMGNHATVGGGRK